MARGKKRKSTAKSFGDFKKSQNEKRLNRIYSQGKKDYASQNRGQSGGSSSISSQGKKDAFTQLQRQKFFDNRPDVSEDRIFKRTAQDTGIDQFKKSLIDQDRVLKDSKGNIVFNENTGEPVYLGSTPVFDNDPSSPTFGQYVSTTVADKSRQLANRYGPTMGEIFGDIGYGLGSIAKGFAEKGSPVMQLLKGLYQKGKNYFIGPSGIESKVPVDMYSSGADAMGGAFVGPTFDDQKINTQRLDSLPSSLSNEEFDKAYPFLPERTVESGNPLFNQQNFEPFKVSNMDMSGVMASNVGQNIIGNLQNLQNLANQYNLNKIQFDPFNPNRIGYKDQFMFNNTPVNYNLSVGDQGLQGGIQFAFKKGGSVDKHGGLGYKLK